MHKIFNLIYLTKHTLKKTKLSKYLQRIGDMDTQYGNICCASHNSTPTSI